MSNSIENLKKCDQEGILIYQCYPKTFIENIVKEIIRPNSMMFSISFFVLPLSRRAFDFPIQDDAKRERWTGLQYWARTKECIERWIQKVQEVFQLRKL